MTPYIEHDMLKSTDGKAYKKDSAGLESQLGGGALVITGSPSAASTITAAGGSDAIDIASVSPTEPILPALGMTRLLVRVNNPEPLKDIVSAAAPLVAV